MKKINHKIDGIFPSPVYRSYNIKKLTKKELDFIEKQKHNAYKNEGNTTSLNTNLLDDPIFKNLKKILTNHLNLYFIKVFDPLEKDLKVYITQSWANYTSQNQYHHMHSHPNSFISGVFYIKANKEVDKIHFHKNIFPSDLSIWPRSFGLYNSKAWFFEIETGMLILFPSTSYHSVQIKEDYRERISISFNTFLKGTVGHKKELTELKL